MLELKHIQNFWALIHTEKYQNEYEYRILKTIAEEFRTYLYNLAKDKDQIPSPNILAGHIGNFLTNEKLSSLLVLFDFERELIEELQSDIKNGGDTLKKLIDATNEDEKPDDIKIKIGKFITILGNGFNPGNSECSEHKTYLPPMKSGRSHLDTINKSNTRKMVRINENIIPDEELAFENSLHTAYVLFNEGIESYKVFHQYKSAEEKFINAIMYLESSQERSDVNNNHLINFHLWLINAYLKNNKLKEAYQTCLSATLKNFFITNETVNNTHNLSKFEKSVRSKILYKAYKNHNKGCNKKIEYSEAEKYSKKQSIYKPC